MRSDCINIKISKPRNLIAKDLRTPKYRIRVAESKKDYNRQSEKLACNREIYV
jgi:hypothetical protein